MNQIRDEGAQAIGQALERNKVRSIFSFFTSITILLYLIQTLITLNLEENQIEDVGAQAVGQALQINQVRYTFRLFNFINIVLYL